MYDSMFVHMNAWFVINAYDSIYYLSAASFMDFQ